MDINNLSEVIVLFSSPNEVERKKAETYFLQLRSTPGFGSALLNISCDDKYPFTSQLQAAIQLKNFIVNYWKFGENTQINESLRFEEDDKIIVISKAEKEFICANIISALAYVVKKGSKTIIKQFCQSIKKIVKYEYKHIWRNYIHAIKSLFDSGDDKNIYTGILVFFQISKIYEFETGEDKADYNSSFDELHPYFIAFLDKLVPVMQNEDASLYLYKIFKIYSKSIQLEISPTIKNSENFKKWLTAIISIKKFELSTELTTKTEKTDEIEALQKTIFWKLKTLCFNITYRLYQKYGVLTNDNKNKNKEFSIALIDNYLPAIFEVNISVLYSSKDKYVSDKALYLIFKFFSQLYAKKHLILELEKHLDVITREFLIQNALLTLKDVELFAEEPKLYITNQFDITTNYYVLRYTICQFVKSVCSYKRDKEKIPCYFESMYKYFVSVLDMYQEKFNSGQSIDIRIKEAVLYILQSLSTEILKYYKETLEKFIELYVLNEFDSKFGFLRERACTFIENFEEYKITNPILIEAITKKICGLLQDKELPVRIMAAIAAPKLLRNEACIEMLAPHVSDILKIYLNLMNDIDLEELIEGLEGIISKFSSVVKQYAVDLTIELVKVFKRLMNSDDEDDIKNEKSLVAEGVLRAIIKMIELFCKYDDVFPSMEVQIEEIVHWGFREDNYDNLFDVLDIIETIVKHSPSISKKTWLYYTPLIDSLIGSEKEIAEFKQKYPDSEFEGLGYDNLSEYIPIFAYFMTKDPDTFLNGTDGNNVSFAMRTLTVVQRIISISKSKKEIDAARAAIQLLVIMVESLKGRIDSLFNEIVIFTITELTKSNSKSYKISLIELISVCFIYNPAFMIKILADNKCIEIVFEKWILAIKDFILETQYKKSLMGFASILLVNPSEQNPIIFNNLNQIYSQIIKLAEEINKRHQPARSSERIKEKTEKNLDNYLANPYGEINDDEEEEEDLFECEEDEEWDEFEYMKDISPLSGQNEFTFLKQVIMNISNTVYYQELVKSVDPASLENLENIIKAEESRK